MEEYSPSCVHLHLNSSSSVSLSCTELVASHNLMNIFSYFFCCFRRENVVYPFPVRHSLLNRDLFLLVFPYSCGAMDFAIVPFIQLEDQNRAFSPFPIVTTVEALNRSRSALSQGTSKFAHALSGCFHLYHNQRNLSALVNLSKSSIPNPPLFLGKQVVGQLISECPPTDFVRCLSSPYKTSKNLINLF